MRIRTDLICFMDLSENNTSSGVSIKGKLGIPRLTNSQRVSRAAPVQLSFQCPLYPLSNRPTKKELEK